MYKVQDLRFKVLKIELWQILYVAEIPAKDITNFDRITG